MEVGHSRLLKFFTKGRVVEMSEPPVIKIQKDYVDPTNVTSEVPGTHELREADATVKNDSDTSTKEVAVAAGFSLSPVITVTQNESILTKGGVRSHKVTVTEDIADHHTENGGHRIIRDIVSSEQKEEERIVATEKRKEETGEEGNMDGEKIQEEKKSKIPITRLRQVVEKVKKERLEQRNRERQKNAPRRSSIPKLKESNIPSKRHTSLKLDPKPEDEFEKIYEEIVDNKQKDIDDKILDVKIEDTAVVESKFEEIIHAYDEDAHTKPTVSRVSKIPALRRRDDDRPSKIGALVDRVRAKSPKADPELKDGGFKVTNISIKRFARGNSRDVSRDERITVAEDREGNEIVDKRTTPPVKPARTYTKEVSKDGSTTVETIEDTTNVGSQTSYTKTIRKDTVHVGMPVRTERIIRGISRELTDDQDVTTEEYNTKNTSKRETVTTETEGGTRTVTTTSIERENSSVGIPIRTERVVRSISRGFSKDSQNNDVLEKPVNTEKIVRNISRKSSEGQIINKTEDIDVDNEFVSIMETSRGITNTYTKQTSLRDNVKVIPVKPERFTRGISIEMGNIKQTTKRDEKETVSIEEFREKSLNGSQKFVKTTQNTITKENVSEDNYSIDKNKEETTIQETKEKFGDAVKETFVTETITEARSTPTDEQINKVIPSVTKEELRKETMKTENVEKEYMKTGIPVLTKLTKTSINNKTEKGETNPFEWKTTDEVQTKNFNRRVSENVTTKEFKNKWKFNTPSFDGEFKEATEKPNVRTVTNKYISNISMQESPRLDINGSKVVTENINNVTIKKVTEYESKEKETNVEKKTYALSNPYDFSIETISRDDKDKKEIDFKQVSEVNKVTNKQFVTDTVTEKRETEYRDLTTLEKDTDNNEVTILKGNVSRLKNKISSIDNVKVSKVEADEDLPKNKSVSSKIAAFERLDPTDYPREKKYLCRKKANKTYIDEKPIIVDEVLKSESYDDRNKVKISLNYEEVEFKNKTGDVNEFWQPANANAENSTINKVITEKTIYLQTGENTVNVETNIPEIKASDTVRTLPAIINFKPNESRIGLAKTMPGNIEFKNNNNQFEVAKPLPGIINFDLDKEVKVTESIVKNDNKTDDPYELPKILPGKVDYETRIGKTRPGKINLNIWKNQVEVNKILLNKEDILKKENLYEIVKVLPDKKDYTKNQVPVIKMLPKTVDLNKDGSQYEVATLLPGKINVEVNESINPPSTLPLVTDIKAKENVFEGRHIQNNQESTHQNIDKVENISYEDYKIKPIDSKISKPSSGFDKFELPTILPDKKDYLKSQYVDTETSENKEANKSIPGKINLNLWKNKVEENKTLLNKIHIKNNVHIEITNSTKNQVERISSLPGRIDCTEHESHVEPIRTLPEQIDFTPSEGKLETIRTIPGQKDFSSKIEPIRTMPGLVDITTHESHEEPAQTLPGRIDFIPAESKIEPKRILPEQIDFTPSESKNEPIRTLPGQIDFTPTKSKNEPIRTLPAVVDFNTNESQTEQNTELPGKEPKSLPGKLDLKAWENQIEGNRINAGSTSSRTNHNVMIKKNTEYVSHIDSEVVEKKHAENVKEFKEQKIIEPEIPAFLPGLTIGTRPRLNNYIGFKFPDEKGLRSDTTEINKGLISKENVTVPSDTDPRESLSDPELVNDEPEVAAQERKNSIMNKIKSKMYFITNKNIIRSTSNISVDTESKFTEYDDTVEDLRTKSYVIDDLYSQNKGQDSSVVTEEYTKESYEQNEKDSITNVEHENEPKTSIQTTEITSNINVTSEYSYKEIREETSKYGYKRSETTEEYKTNREEMKRAKSLAELDLGDVVTGQVRRMVRRMKSVDFGRRKDIKVEKINVKEMPKKMSVLEKIALFEEQARQWYSKPESLQGKAAANQADTTTLKTRTTTKPAPQAVPEEVYLQKIQELETAKNTLGRMEKMVYLTLSDGREMPVIAVGTALVDNRLLPHLIGAAIELGYRAFDTAYIYGNEKEIGKAIRAKIDDGTVRREELFIISKLWSTFHRRDLVEPACRSSLEKMGLDYFDLFMIHNPMSFKEGPDPIPTIASVVQYSEHDFMDAWFGMEALLPLGLARSLGVSNFNSQQVQRVLDKGKVRPVVNQVECHPYLSQEHLHAYCADRNIVLSCFGVLGSKGTPAEYKSSMTPVIDDPLVKVMASGLGVTPAQLLIRYQIEFGHNVVVKASSAAHLWDNLQALSFSLDKGQVTALQALNKNKRTFTFKGMGDTHKNYPFVGGF